MRVEHGFGPVYDAESRVLILGSFPSVKSREVGFYYGHPQNRFWRVLGRVLNDPVPDGIAEKKAYLSRHGVALWDSVVSCEITGSADSAIRGAEPADLSRILSVAPIRALFCNGALSYSLLTKHA
ncbi:MAG: DNA-deoxyinosine glycosylase, partial [Clostridia bacterium]|nr:DNA-deoxyinosine glycosylase [Clostridia bacterium]